MEFTSNNLHLHVSTAGDIIAALRFARFHAAPMHGLRPQTLLSAPGPFAEQCSLFGPNGKMFAVSVFGLSLNPEPSHSSFRINSPQLNLLRGDSLSLKGHRLLVKDAEWCHPTYRKFEGAHPRKGKAKSTGIKRKGTGRYGASQKKRSKELERVDGRSGLRILMCGCPGSFNPCMGRHVSTRPPSSLYGTDYAPESQG